MHANLTEIVSEAPLKKSLRGPIKLSSGRTEHLMHGRRCFGGGWFRRPQPFGLHD